MINSIEPLVASTTIATISPRPRSNHPAPHQANKRYENTTFSLCHGCVDWRPLLPHASPLGALCRVCGWRQASVRAKPMVESR